MASHLSTVTDQGGGVESTASGEVVRGWDFKASEGALGLSLLTPANSLLVQRQVGKYVRLGWG